MRKRTETRGLLDLSGIGPALLKDLHRLGIHSVHQLARMDPQHLYERLCRSTRTRQDPCVLDAFTCAVAQAKDPSLPSAKRRWWYWSRLRLAGVRGKRRRKT